MPALFMSYCYNEDVGVVEFDTTEAREEAKKNYEVTGYSTKFHESDNAALIDMIRGMDMYKRGV
jgi:hypothetical protein